MQKGMDYHEASDDMQPAEKAGFVSDALKLIPDIIPEDILGTALKAVSGNLLQDVAVNVLEDIAEDVVQTVTDVVTADAAEDVPEDIPEDVPDQTESPEAAGGSASAGRNNLEVSDGSNADIQTLSDIDGWLGDINPNFDAFDPESPYCNNCGSCALAVYNRLNGDTDACATAENIGYNDEMNALTGMEQVSMSPEEIESRLLEAGDGAHAIIGIDRAEGPGHWFNAACVDGKVVAIDGQSGEIMAWPPDYGDVVNWEMSVEKED